MLPLPTAVVTAVDFGAVVKLVLPRNVCAGRVDVKLDVLSILLLMVEEVDELLLVAEVFGGGQMVLRLAGAGASNVSPVTCVQSADSQQYQSWS